MLEDRGYQADAASQVLSAWSDGDRNVCLSMPTGSGKTAAAARIAAAVKADGARSAFLTDKLTLLSQTAATMRAGGLSTAVVQGDRTETTRLDTADVLLCSSQTLQSRGLLPDDLGVLLGIIDECHGDRDITRRWLASPHVMLGLTATPLARWMTEGAPAPWDRLVQPVTTRDAINAGWLLEPLFRADVPDPTETVDERPAGGAGDWSDQQAESIMAPYLDRIVDAWQGMIDLHERDGGLGGYDAPTIVQACTIRHAECLAEAFTRRTGRPWCAVTADTGQDASEDAVAAFRAGAVAGLCSVSKLSIGFDAPEAVVLLSARPTNSILAWLQLVGRVMRVPLRGLHRAVVQDCAGNAHRHAARLHRFWSNGASWPLGRPEARDPSTGAPPETTAVQPCPDHPTIVQPPGSSVCVVCNQPLRPVEQPKASRVWRDAIDPEELGRSVIALAQNRLLRGDEPDRVVKWARMQVKTLTGRWPSRSWPAIGPPDPFDLAKPHPVVARLIRTNLKHWRDWQTMDPEDRPSEPPAERIALAETA